MDCADYESEIAAWLDGRLPPTNADGVARHVAGCPICGAFARSLRELDAALARRVQLRPLSSDFNGRLRARIEAEAPGDTEVRRTELKRQLQAEYDTTLARMQRRFRSFTSVLDALGLGLLSAGALTAAVLHAPKLVQAMPADLQARLGTPMVVGAALGTLVVLAGAWFVTRRPARLTSML